MQLRLEAAERRGFTALLDGGKVLILYPDGDICGVFDPQGNITVHRVIRRNPGYGIMVCHRFCFYHGYFLLS